MGKLIFLFLIVFLSSCSKNNLVTPYVAEVLNLYPPEKAENIPIFKSEPQKFIYLENFDNLSSSKLKLLQGGDLNLSLNSSVATGGGFSNYNVPNLRYKIENNIAIMLDYMSYAEISAYYNIEKILNQINIFTPINLDEFLQMMPNKYLELIFEPKIIINNENISVSVLFKRNAAFVSGSGQIVLFERSKYEKIPLSCNAQVLAHEFGHILFEYFFYNNQYNIYQTILNNDIINGFNEGIADFYSYKNTGSTNILGASLTSNTNSEQRNFSIIKYDDATIASCNNTFYCIGSLFAKSLYLTEIQLSSTNDKLNFSKLIFQNLQLMASKLVTENLFKNIEQYKNFTYNHDKFALFLFYFIQAMKKNVTTYNLQIDLYKNFCSNLNKTFPITLTKDLLKTECSL